MEVKEYEEKYAKGLSDVILSNLYTINIKDHGKDVIDSIAQYFTEEAIKKNFPDRIKCFVAVDGETVLGTASIDSIKDFYGLKVDNPENKYMILSVFISIDNQKQGIGRLLIQRIEEYAKEIGARELLIQSSVYALDFYRKLGFDYYKGINTQNEEGEYTLSKSYN